MATLIVDGQKFILPDDEAEALKKNLGNLDAGENVTCLLLDDDGDESWVFIPAGYPVIIGGWEPDSVNHD
jgi:hypothetical protein